MNNTEQGDTEHRIVTSNTASNVAHKFIVVDTSINEATATQQIILKKPDSENERELYGNVLSHNDNIAESPGFIIERSGKEVVIEEHQAMPQDFMIVVETGDAVDKPAEITSTDAPAAEDNFKAPMLSSRDTRFMDFDIDAACQVCSDKGSGYHYSAYTCEGCKGFFKRTVQRNLVYKCKAEGHCIINRHTRNNCQACRFDACLLIGMKREAVREDRSPGGPGKNRPKFPRIEAIGADGRRPPFKDELVTALYEAQPYLIPPSDVTVLPDKDTHEDISKKTFMHFGYTELRYIIDWAKKVPGFKDLVIDDQMALLKSSFMELNVLRLAFRSMTGDKIVIAAGVSVPAPDPSDTTSGAGLMVAASKFAKRIRDTNMDRTEFSIINALILTYPDAVGLTERPKVLALQTTIVDALRRYSTYQYPNEPHRYGNMLLRLPILRIVSAKAAEKFLSMTLDWNLPISDLVCEMMN